MTGVLALVLDSIAPAGVALPAIAPEMRDRKVEEAHLMDTRNAGHSGYSEQIGAVLPALGGS